MITDFIKKNDVSEELIKEYEDKLPSEMIAFWKEFGFGTFYKGYLKSINPNEYKNLLEKSYFLGDVSIPIFATAFGDLITWEEDQYVGIVKYRYGVPFWFATAITLHILSSCLSPVMLYCMVFSLFSISAYTRKYLFVPLFANGFDTPSTRIFGCCSKSFPNHCISLTVPCNLTFSI